MKDYAELEKRLRHEAQLNRDDFALFAEQYAELVTEAADAISELTKRCEEVVRLAAPFVGTPKEHRNPSHAQCFGAFDSIHALLSRAVADDTPEEDSPYNPDGN